MSIRDFCIELLAFQKLVTLSFNDLFREFVKKNKLKKVAMFLAIILTILMILIFLAVKNIAPYAILQPQRINENITPAQLGLISEKIEIETRDAIILNGYWTKTKTPEIKGIMILIHGVGGCKEHFLGLAGELSRRGIESIVFDGRAHGKSGGQYCTYGFNEKKDVTDIVDFIKTKTSDLSIGIWGNSLGGAVALQSLEYDERIQFGVIESTFTALDQIVIDYKKRMLGFGFRFMSDYALKQAGEIANFNPDEVKPIESVKNIEQPILITHGDADKNISYKYGQQLFDNLKSEDKEFVLVEGGGHSDMYLKGGAEYKVKIMDFIERNFE